MNPATEQLFRAAMALPEGERWELVEALLAEGEQAEGPALDPAYRDEIRRRSAEIDAGSVELTPWSVVRDRVWREAAGRSGG